MATWFTSDTHFGHRRIIQLCKRPYADVETMDADLIGRRNAVVGVDDDVWHLGNFSYRNSKDFKNYARALQGRIHLIKGNHDNDAVRNWEGWASSQDLAEVVVEGQRLVLCHYGMRVWRGSHHGAIHLFGHSHGSLPGDGKAAM